MTRHLDDLTWDNSFARLPGIFYQRVTPTPLTQPRLAAFNPDAAALLDLGPDAGGDPDFVAGINGDRPIAGTDPVAAIYAGHQFGVWVPQLGDGRAILLGEVVNDRHERWDVQVKGSGLTRFSRMGDGRAVLRSTIREYLASEAMHGLGIPSTRALAIVASDLPVYRETVERAAVLVRIAPTHVRFGSFEVFASRSMFDAVAQLADYVIGLHLPQLLTLAAAERYAGWYREVVSRTARLMAAWTATGFTHGVLNTDNMSILGITLDYGPYGWIDRYDPGFIPNHSDPAGRYAFDQQPMVGLWNCARLGEALRSLLTESDILASLESYREVFDAELGRLMRAKLGLVAHEPDDADLATALFAILNAARGDYTRAFRALSRVTSATNPDASSSAGAVRDAVEQSPAIEPWLARYTARLRREHSIDAERHQRMLRTNPKFVLRNWMAQEVIVAAESGEFASIDELRSIVAAPFDEHPGAERFAGRPPAWAADLALSCSS
ncbi:MAG TPA: YdiU family protein [Gemmatimonadales bacterium]